MESALRVHWIDEHTEHHFAEICTVAEDVAVAETENSLLRLVAETGGVAEQAEKAADWSGLAEIGGEAVADWPFEVAAFATFAD